MVLSYIIIYDYNTVAEKSLVTEFHKMFDIWMIGPLATKGFSEVDSLRVEFKRQHVSFKFDQYVDR